MTRQHMTDTELHQSETHTGLQTVQAFYAALSRGDVPGVLALLAPDLRWTEAEGFPYYSGTWTNPIAVRDNLLVPIAHDWDEFKATAEDFVVQGDRIVSLGAYTGIFKKTAKQMTAQFAHVWTVDGGKIVRFDMYTDTAKVLEAMR